MNHQTLTVIIAAKNEAHQISECVRSVLFADEIIVLDSGSTDATTELAAAAGASVHITDWIGYGPQQARGIKLAKSDWVLSLDADERITDALQEEIKSAIAADDADGYRLPRTSSFCGTFMKASGWTPDYTLRLARRSKAGFTDHFLHAHMTVAGTTKNLKSPIVHFSYRTLDDVLEKLNRYSRGSAFDALQNGKSSSFEKALAKGIWAFLRTYFVRQGFRDGKMGFILALYNAETTYYKYLRIWLSKK